MRARLFVFLSSLSLILPAQAETITLGWSSTPTEPPALVRLFTQIYKDVGFDLVLEPFPGRRGLVEADAGRIDGDAMRVPANIPATDYPNLVLVPEPIATLNNTAYSTRKLKISSLEDLATQNLRIVTYSGLLWATKDVKPLIAANNWSEVATYEQALKMLLLERVDVMLASEVAVNGFLAQPEYNRIRPVGVLASVQVYTFLNKKWAPLVPALIKSIKKNRAR